MGYKKGERGISTDRQSERKQLKKKKERKRRRRGRRREKEREKADALLLLRTCHISGMRRGNSGSRRDRGRERRAFFSQQQNFLQHLMATSQALFFKFGLRKSWLVAWSTSFRCTLCSEGEQRKQQVTNHRPTNLLLKCSMVVTKMSLEKLNLVSIPLIWGQESHLLSYLDLSMDSSKIDVMQAGPKLVLDPSRGDTGLQRGIAYQQG